MIIDLLPFNVSDGLRSCRIEIVSDNAISPVHSRSKLVQPPVQLTPYGSSWMKIGSCPAKVKERMKLKVPGMRLTKQEKRWRASIHQRNTSTFITRHEEHDCSGLLRKCQSDSNLLSRLSTPKMPVRTSSPKSKTVTIKLDSMANETWDVMKAPSKPVSLLGHLHPSVFPEGLDSRPPSLSHSLQEAPSVSPNSGIEAIDCDNLTSNSSPCSGLRMPKCNDCVESSAFSHKIANTTKCATKMTISSFESSKDNITLVLVKASSLYEQQGRRATSCTSKGRAIATEYSPEDESSMETHTEINSTGTSTSY